MPDPLAAQPTPSAPRHSGTVWPTDPTAPPSSAHATEADAVPRPDGVPVDDGDAVADRGSVADGDSVADGGPVADPAWQVWDGPRPFNRLSAALGIALVAVLAFGGGILLQQKTGTSSGTAPTGFPVGQLGGSGRQGYGGQGFAGFPGAGAPGGLPGAGSGPAAGGAGASAGAGSGSGGTPAATSSPVVIGTVVSVTPSGAGGSLVVRNLGGASVTVAVPASATVTVTGLSARLAPGARVVVHGTRAGDKVTATAITVR